VWIITVLQSEETISCGKKALYVIKCPFRTTTCIQMKSRVQNEQARGIHCTRETLHEQVFLKNTHLDILFINVYTMEINSVTVHRERETQKVQGKGGKIKQAERGERQRERLFKNCFSLLGLLFVVH